MQKPNLNKIIADNLDKTSHISKKAPASLPTGWIHQYKRGGGMFPEYDSYAPPRHAMGGQTGDPNQPYHPITNPDGYHPQNVLEKIKKLPNKNKPYEPSQMVNNAKALLAGTDLATGFSGNPYAQAGNFLARLANSTGDAYTAARYAMDGQWGNAGVDAGEALLDLIPFRKGKNVINLSKTNGLPGTYNKLSKLDKSLNNGLKAAKAGASADDFMHSSMGKFLFGDPDSQVKYKDGGGLLSRTVTCSSCGHSWKGITGGMDPLTCHNCGGMIKMSYGGDISIPDLDADKWLLQYKGGGSGPGFGEFFKNLFGGKGGRGSVACPPMGCGKFNDGTGGGLHLGQFFGKVGHGIGDFFAHLPKPHLPSIDLDLSLGWGKHGRVRKRRCIDEGMTWDEATQNCRPTDIIIDMPGQSGSYSGNSSSSPTVDVTTTVMPSNGTQGPIIAPDIVFNYRSPEGNTPENLRANGELYNGVPGGVNDAMASTAKYGGEQWLTKYKPGGVTGDPNKPYSKSNPQGYVSMKNNQDWFDNHANWTNTGNQKWDAKVRQQVLTGRFGIDPSSGALIKLPKNEWSNVSDEYKTLAKDYRTWTDEEKIANPGSTMIRQSSQEVQRLAKKSPTFKKYVDTKKAEIQKLDDIQLKRDLTKSMYNLMTNPVMMAPGAILTGGMLSGVPAIAETAAAIAPALETSIGGVPGLTAGNLLNAGFAYQGAKNLPNVASAWKDVSNKPTWGGLGNAVSETVLTGLDMFPFLHGTAKGIPSVMQDVNQAGNWLNKGYNNVATGNSVLPFAWKSPAVGLSEEASQNMFKNVLNSDKLTDAERAVVADYQRIGKVKNDVGGYDWIVKPKSNSKFGSLSLNNKSTEGVNGNFGNWMVQGPEGPSVQLATDANNTIQKEAQNIMQDLTSPEGATRLRNQFKIAMPNATEEQLDHLVGNRLREVNTSMANNKARFYLRYGNGAYGTPSFGTEKDLFPEGNAHFANNYNPFPEVGHESVPTSLNFNTASIAPQTKGGLGDVGDFTNPDYRPGSITLGNGYQFDTHTVRHEAHGHALQGSGWTNKLPLEHDLLDLAKPKTLRDKLWFEWQKRTKPNFLGNYNYFTKGDGTSRESFPYLVENRSLMKERGLINNTYDDVTANQLLKHKQEGDLHIKYGIPNSNDRFLQMFPKWKLPKVADIWNAAPAVVPVVGTGAVGAAVLSGEDKKTESIPQQKYGGMITDPMGQWKYPGMNTRIPGGNITMQGVSYPVLAKANNGMTTMMYPGQEYNFPGASHVDEYPIMQNGGWLSKYQKAQDGVEYTGPSIVDYLATRGYSGKKAFRKKLAEKYDVEDYNFSADKNLELLAKLRENDDMLEQDFKPTQTPIPMEKLLEMEKEQATYKTVPKVQYDKKTSAPSIVNTIVKVKQPAFDAGAFNARLNLANMNFNPITSPNRQFLQNRMSWTPTASVPDVQQTAPQQPTDSIPQGMNPAVLNMMLSTQRPMNQTSAVNIPNNPFGSITGGGAQQSPEIQQAQSYVDNGFRAPYVQPIQNPYKFDNRMFTGKKSKTISVADMYPEINNQQSAGQFIAPNYVMPKEIGESTMTPDNVRQKMIEHIVTNNIRVTKTPDDLTDKVLKGDWINIGKDVFKKVRPIIETISPDLAIQGDSYFKRQDLKNNDTLQETKTKLTLPVETSNSISPAIITGDTVRLPTPDIKDRYIIPSQIDLKQTSWGIRNRGDYTPIDTEGGDITLFNNFVPANEYFKTNTVSDDASFIGVDNQGKVVTGKKKDFINSNIPISKTYSNKIVDFPTDANGKLQLKPSSPKASNKHLSPVTLNLDENGKQIKGSINLLIPKKNKSTDSFGDITGGRVIFTSPDGKESVFASGSADDIVTVFKNLKTKGNYPYLTAYTLDNGTYGPGLRKTSGKITSEDLKAYQGKNATGSVFLYLKNGNYSRASKNTETPILKYKDINMTTPNIRTEKDESYKKGHPLVNEQSAIVLHHTGYSDTTGISQGQSKAMKGVMDQFSRPGESSHVVIDFNGIRYNYARPDQVTFHAGKSAMNGRENVNDFGIGIEFQGDTDNKPLTDNQIESFVEYIAPIIKDKRIPLKNIITHKQIRSDYMKVHPEDKQVLGKPDVNERDYNRIKQALIKKGIYQEPIKKKKLGGVVNIGDKMDVTEEQLEQLKKQGYKFNIV